MYRFKFKSVHFKESTIYNFILIRKRNLFPWQWVKLWIGSAILQLVPEKDNNFEHP